MTTIIRSGGSSSAASTSQPVFHFGTGQFRGKGLDQSLIGPPVVQTEHPRWGSFEEAELLIDRDGYVVIPRLFDEQQTSRMLERLVHGGKPDAEYEVKGWCFNKHLDFELQQRPDWLWAIDQEPAIDLMDRLLGSDCKLMGAGLWSTGPGRQMPFHVDHRVFELGPTLDLPPGFPLPCNLAVLIAALEDQDPAMGPTTIIPGTHRRPPRAGDPPVIPRSLVMRRGDAVILRADLCHGAIANTGPRRRNHFHSTWCSAFVEPFGPPMRYEKYWAQETIKAATVRQRRILGGWPHANGGREQVWLNEMGLGGDGPAAGY